MKPRELIWYGVPALAGHLRAQSPAKAGTPSSAYGARLRLDARAPVLKSRRDDLFIVSMAPAEFFLFFSGAGSKHRHNLTREPAPLKNKKKGRGKRLANYKQAIPTGFGKSLHQTAYTTSPRERAAASGKKAT